MIFRGGGFGGGGGGGGFGGGEKKSGKLDNTTSNSPHSRIPRLCVHLIDLVIC